MEIASSAYQKGIEAEGAGNYSQAYECYTAAAHSGITDGYVRAGLCCLSGRGVKRDYKKAIRWFRVAADLGNVAGQYNLGNCYFNGIGVSPDLTQAVQYYLAAAEQGDARSQSVLGVCYCNGRGVSIDLSQAIRWFRAAASQGDPWAQCQLATCYRDGSGTHQDDERAIHWYELAAAQGNNLSAHILRTYYKKEPSELPACNKNEGQSRLIHNADSTPTQITNTKSESEGSCNQQNTECEIDNYLTHARGGDAWAQWSLGNCYRDGKGVEQDFEQAVSWFLAAAEQGHEWAQYDLAICYKNGQGVTRDLTQSAKWMRVAAEQGLEWAQYELAAYYRDGLGVARDPAQSARWYRAAAEQENKWAQCELGVCYLEGVGVERDYAEAVRWFQAAARQGNAEAQNNLGGCYYEGKGADVNYKQAASWFRAAAEQGHVFAQSNLGICYKEGHGVERDYAEAARWFRAGAELGNVWAQYNLGICYRDGIGVEQDYKESEHWFRLAAEQGHKPSEENLATLLGMSKPASDTSSAVTKTHDIETGHGNVSTLDEALAELDGLIGLGNVKARVQRLVRRMRIYERRRELGLVVPETTNHCIFMGNPGTGKTTVARILAQIYKCLGIVSKGHLVETDRSGLVGGYVGQTALKTKEVVERALGGVLFIDEAYSLVGKSENDFGIEAIEILLKMMEDNRSDLIVIAAGYRDEMQGFVDSNPGLRSRFQNFIDFEDYNGEELLAIFERLCERNGYFLTPCARNELARHFDSLTANKLPDFANGREARKIFDKMIDVQSTRIWEESVSLDEVGEEILSTFTVDDVRKACE